MKLWIVALFAVAVAGDVDPSVELTESVKVEDHDATLEIVCDVPSNSFKGQSNVLESCVDEENCADYYGGEYPYCHHILYRSLWDQLVGNEGTHSCICKNVKQATTRADECGTTVLEGELTEEDLEGIAPEAVDLLLTLEAEGR